MPNYIEESGMHFIAENAFYIEKSAPYIPLKGSGIKSVEFIRIRNHDLLFVEAKTSIANPGNPDVENLKKFNTEIEDICDKFIHSLNLFSAIMVGVKKETLPIVFDSADQLSLMLILVVKDHDLKWCKPVQQKLQRILPEYFKKIWKPVVHVINHDAAIKHGIAIEIKEPPYGSLNPNRT
ncbi:hypothetical protein AGMMS50268_03680 [Spirochaetia bacterium]|nr:hypothetical protein AGMMS50268_03680 [Spirochaetia bacterium]